MVIRDVNNYIAETWDGKVKEKGCFETQKDWHKDNSYMVVPLAVRDFFVSGVPIIDTFKHINEYHTGLYVNDVEIVSNGIGVVTDVDEHGNGLIEFVNGSQGVIINASLGEMIFQTVDAGANIVNIRALSKNRLSDTQINSLIDLIYHRLSTGENTITVNGKEKLIIGNQAIGRGIVDSLILVTARQNKEKQIFFLKNGSLVVGRKEFTFEDKPETVKQAIYEALLAGNNEVNFKKDIKPDSEFVLPTLKEGEWKGETTTYNNYIFGGENPLIGTFVDSVLSIVPSPCLLKLWP